MLEQQPVDDLLIIDDERWEELLELTGGAASICYQCGVCTAVCPWGLVRNETVSVRTLVRQAQLGLLNAQGTMWLCSTCAQCESYCPRGVDIPDVLRGSRYLAWQQRQIPKGLPSLLWSIYWNNNPWDQPPSQRSQWAKALNIPTFDPLQHEILLYVGCTSSYDRRAQSVARALVRILKAAGVSFGFLGDNEPCCGESALSVGHKPYFQEIVQRAAQVFAENGVERVLTISPHCYDVFKNYYPNSKQPGSITAFHYTEYLAQLIEEGCLSFRGQRDRAFTFHDPCYMARHNDDVTSARRVLRAIPGIRIVEMAHTGIETLCCGGGGGRMWQETEPGQRFANIRVREAIAVGAEVLVTACPFCIVCLEDSLKREMNQNLITLDLAEVVALAIDGES